LYKAPFGDSRFLALDNSDSEYPGACNDIFNKSCISAGFINGDFELYSGIRRLKYIFWRKKKIRSRSLSANHEFANLATPGIAYHTVNRTQDSLVLVYYLSSVSYFHFVLYPPTKSTEPMILFSGTVAQSDARQ